MPACKVAGRVVVSLHSAVSPVWGRSWDAAGNEIQEDCSSFAQNQRRLALVFVPDLFSQSDHAGKAFPWAEESNASELALRM